MTAVVPAWLDSPPTKAVSTLPLETRLQSLPFGELTWPNFERLVLRLVRRQATVRDCALYGTAGQAQDGLDILAILSGESGKYACYQCKRVKKFADSDIKKAVTKFIDGKWVDSTSEFILCVAIPLDSTKQQNEIAKQRRRLKKKGITLSIWDGADGGILIELLKKLPMLVDDFFGRPWVAPFNGDAAAAGLDQRLDGNELADLRQKLIGLYSTVFTQHDPGLRSPGQAPLGYLDRYVPIDVIEVAQIGETEPNVPADLSASSTENGARSTLESDVPERQSTSHDRSIEIRRPAFDWISSKQHCVILGEPGYGKSALLRYLALSLLDPETTSIPLSNPDHLQRLPVWMSFARYAKAIKEAPNTSVEDYIADWLHQNSYNSLHPVFERALKRSEVLLLVDGLDEGMSEQHRREALDRVITFGKSRDAAIVCTSRPRGFSQIGVPDGWDISSIALMTDGQVQDLAARWFAVTEQNDTTDSDGRAATSAQRRAETFLHATKENHRTQDLSRNPLLCHALIELFRFSHRLPEARIGAYEKIVDLLLSQHPAARNKAAFAEAPTRALGLREADLRGILIRLAAEFQTNATSATGSLDDCNAICAAFLEDETDGLGLDKPVARRQAEESIELLIHHYGLLVERSPSDIGFVHLSIQEYLAAEHMTQSAEDGQLDWIKSVWLQPNWRECLNSWFGIQGSRGKKGLTGRAAQLLEELGDVGEWQRMQSLEFRTELSCMDLGLPIAESRRAVREATREVERSPFRDYRVALAKSITLGAIESSVQDECTSSIDRWVPGRPSFSRARLLGQFSSWRPEADLWDTLCRAMCDEELHCRRAAVDSLVAVFGSSEALKKELSDIAVNHAQSEVRATAMHGLSSRPEWEDSTVAAATANLASCNVELMLAVCSARIQHSCQDDSDLDRIWRIWSTEAAGYLYRDTLIVLLCDGWPAHAGIRERFMEVLGRHGSSIDDQVPLEYLLRCYPGDDEIASRVAQLFDRHELHISTSTETVWPLLVDNFRRHPLLVNAIRQALDSHKEKYAAIHWHPSNVPAYIVIGDEAARDELLNAYPNTERDMGRYWIAKTLIEGWPSDEQVVQSLRGWSTDSVDRAAPLAEWGDRFFPDPTAREKWLKNIVKNSEDRIVFPAMKVLIDEFADEETRELVDTRAKSTEIWAYHRIKIQGLLASKYPDRQSSLRTVEQSLSEIDGPQISDFSDSYQNHPVFRKKILASAVAAPLDVRTKVANTVKDRAIDIRTVERLTPHLLAEENGAVRATGLVGRARASKGHETATESLSTILASELSSLGTYYQSRRRTAIAALVELGQLERIADTMKESAGGDWTHCLHDTLNKDPVSISIIVDKWGALKPHLEAKKLSAELPIKSLVDNGYALILGQSEIARELLDDFLLGEPPEWNPINYFNEIAQRFPRSEYLRDRLLAQLDGPSFQDRMQLMAARLIVQHFAGDDHVLSLLVKLFTSAGGEFRPRPPGVTALLSIGWPKSAFETELRSTAAGERDKWRAIDRLLTSLALNDASAAESAARELLKEPLRDWRYQPEARGALSLWARNPRSKAELMRWVDSSDGTLSITSLSLIVSEAHETHLEPERLIKRFNKQASVQKIAPTDGLDAISGAVIGWANRAEAFLSSTH